MRLILHGGFAEKGRTCIAVESDGYRLLLDAGVKTSSRGNDYYPAITEAQLRSTDAMVLTHAHEDHLAALGWCIAGGFNGRIFITPESRRDLEPCLMAYGDASHVELVRNAIVEPLPVGDGVLQLGPLRVSTGRSGHVAGGVWCIVDDGVVRFDYCGDVVPASPVFTMDPLPACRVIVIDASYGDDDVRAAERAEEVGEWIADQPTGCVLPTPRYGRSAELLAIVPGLVALAPGMRDALRTQIDDRRWLTECAADSLAVRLDAAVDWQEGAPLPRAALLCDDGMGMAGVSRAILVTARAQRHPTLFTGHLPKGSPGEQMVAEGSAAWIRLPTHPTRSENIALVAGSGATTVLGHSCDRATLARLGQHMPSLRVDLATGDSLDL